MTLQLLPLLDEHGIVPVLVDIGASGSPPSIWRPIASRSTYVGFDPDLRELTDQRDGEFRRGVTVPYAVTADADKADVRFFLTRSPFCSSTLRPDSASLSDFTFQDLFDIEREVSVKATTLKSVLDDLGLDRIDWLKADTQGTDLRLFESLPENVRARVLALDVEPGLIDAYEGEDLFVDTHRTLCSEGFWLSNLKVLGSVRARPSTLQDISRRYPGIGRKKIEAAVRETPGWCEARYLRTLPWLAERDGEKRDYILLWIFAALDAQYAFLLDVAAEFGRRFGRDSTAAALETQAIALIEARRTFADRIRRRLRRSLNALLGRQ